jgi:hypothetical protein
MLHFVHGLLAACLLDTGIAHAQARGPSAGEILAHGQDIVSVREQFQIAATQAVEAASQEQEALLDPAVRAARLADLDAWFRRIPGRFRIDGLISRPECREGACESSSGKITGVADCTGIGDGAGVQCVLSADWPTIESGMASVGGPLPPSEKLRTICPAVLVLGLNLDPPGVRAQMVDAESLSHTWVGKLTGNTLTARRVNGALAGHDIQPLQIIAEPDSEVVTIVLHGGSLTITFTMHRDPTARAEKPIKTLRWH